jgi:hypothetical protein
MRGILIAPSDRFGRLVVVADVATNLLREVRDRRKDARPHPLRLVGRQVVGDDVSLPPLAAWRRSNRCGCSPARILGPNLETADASFEFSSLIDRQCQRDVAPESTSTASVSTSH